MGSPSSFSGSPPKLYPSVAGFSLGSTSIWMSVLMGDRMRGFVSNGPFGGTPASACWFEVFSMNLTMAGLGAFTRALMYSGNSTTSLPKSFSTVSLTV